MESSSNASNVEIEVKNFEQYVGKLTENYPFEYSNTYSLNNDPYCHYSKCLTLNKDGTFVAYYLFTKGDDSMSSMIEFKAQGKFSYNVERRTLTLNRETMEQDKFFDCLANVPTVGLVPDLVKQYYPEKMEINNFTWISPTINWLVIRILLPFADAYYPDLNFESNRCDTVTAEAFYRGEIQFERLCDWIKTITTVPNPATTLTSAVTYGETCLNTDGTFTLKSDTHSRDSDGPYNWDSYVNISGVWTYDSEKKLLSLIYHNFNIDDDGKQKDPANYGFFNGKTVTTENFYFESNFIMAVNCGFSYSSPVFDTNYARRKIE